MGLSPIVFRPAKEVNDTKIYITSFQERRNKNAYF